MPDRPELKPTLKPLQVGALSLGCIIGFGCFVLPGDFLVTAGPLGATLGVLLGGAAMLVIARSYGVMVRAFPVAGAEFAYAYHACGRYHAYVCGWFLALGYLSIVPLNATALVVLGTFVAPQLFARGSLYTVAGFEVFAGEIVLASAAIIGIGLFQIRGVRSVGRLQVGMTALLVGGVLIVGLGTPTAGAASGANLQPYFTPDRSPVAGVLAMLAIAPWLYVGFDTLPQAAEEFDFSPRQGLRLMVLSIGAGAVMYAVVILATASVMPWQDLVASEPLWATGTIVRASLGTAGLACLALAVTMAVFTGINGFFMASSRLLFGMGRAKLLPPGSGGSIPRTTRRPTRSCSSVSSRSPPPGLAVRSSSGWSTWRRWALRSATSTPVSPPPGSRKPARSTPPRGGADTPWLAPHSRSVSSCC